LIPNAIIQEQTRRLSRKLTLFHSVKKLIKKEYFNLVRGKICKYLYLILSVLIKLLSHSIFLMHFREKRESEIDGFR
jgi:hypothetical protein